MMRWNPLSIAKESISKKVKKIKKNTQSSDYAYPYSLLGT